MLPDISSFQLPENVCVEEETFSSTYCKLIAEPLERGYGVTLGNALRRVLLSSIEGAAITSIKIDGVFHEFSTIKGVKEDVVEVILNLKKIRLSIPDNDMLTAFIDVKDKDVVTASDIVGQGAVIGILNPDAHIATLDTGADFKAELTIRKGRGYVPAEELKSSNMPIGTIAIDAIYTPVKKVVFNVEKTRVGKSTDYDRLILEVWTDGSINPKEAIDRATEMLIKHLKFFMLVTPEEELEEKEISNEPPTPVVVMEPEPVYDEPVTVPEEDDREFNKNLTKAVDELEFSVRSQNCLKNADIKYIYELVQKTEDDMLKMKNFGRKSLDEIREVLLTMGLDFGAKIDIEAVKRELAERNGG
ncbi:MAG: DNA-directed RNA polymerase subunit alpha [Candidatus Magnetobacterium sp. LHC-1]|uniref:DNA-directed RNA polymerase subunit alpha n=1 Tax=Candidatus Magnetobacterium casense TaxID=1455061 RepID=A0ABS6RVM5_9BACT|nr:DNA-directed RNA polymerase subunit alpha [Candidatus Magnetobacterium casensis]MBF0607803.1 DNA-directed RNA polymerase subunit alpha [Nitrospirota bacterium]MBV6340685.1 DNA-directed RNA polymerase subunit alpha [Candidatus Magnetobacterium casensis]